MTDQLEEVAGNELVEHTVSDSSQHCIHSDCNSFRESDDGF